MSTVAFLLIAFMLSTYVVLDGYDLGVAIVTPLFARTDRERHACMQAIGPFWNGNEVWLIAAGGALFALFPKAYASAFSGFYLPLMVMLWLLMGRGVALELREHFTSDLWHQFWDAIFWISSLLLVVIFGVALGNLIRGVPLDAQGYFDGTFGFLLNPYALFVGLLAVVVLGIHGVAFLSLRVEGAIGERALKVVRTPWAFAGTTALIAFLLVMAWWSMFPYLVPAYPRGSGGISAFDAAPAPTALASALTVTLVGIVAVCIYSAIVWRKLAGKVRVGE